MGLREKKRERTRLALLAAAHALFLHKSYDEATVEDIAERAQLAVGTLYNYFPSKGELLLALITDSDERYLKEGQQLIDNPPDNPVHALAEVMVLATEHCVRQLGKSIWRHVSASSITNAASTFGHQYAVTTKKHEQLVVKMMKALQERGDIRCDIDAKAASHYLFSMKSKLFINYVSRESMTISEHRTEVRKGVGFFLSGICTEPAVLTNKHGERRFHA